MEFPNLSVWQTYQQLHDFTYRSRFDPRAHRETRPRQRGRRFGG
ncbi:MAG TPA: hypothetical protein VGJ13_07940 [Pseudonocardiaceae bacterium]